ncbi:MAG: ParA family protein [Burkholderiaceae bacterium]|nr:ParA family protein [Burkholderiaceae bacterium]
MPVVAIVNRKGGSGKSTLATHLAAYLERRGTPVMLGDVDRQLSTQAWLARRNAKRRSAIVGWKVEPKNVVRPPAGIAHVVLDTPGGLRGFDLARVVIYADAIVMPVCNSAFDRESAAECYAELMTMPRVASGRCKVAAIGMRLDARTKAGEALRLWAQSHGIAYIGALRETQTYVRCIDQGLSVFDLPPSKAEADLAQWQPILEWLAPVFDPPRAASDAEAKRAPAAPLRPEIPLRPPTSATAPRTQRPVTVTQREPLPVLVEAPARPPTVAARIGRLIDALSIPRFLQRNP